MRENIFGELEKLEDKIGFIDFIKDIDDHRLDRKKLYTVAEIVFLAFCGYIANCNSWEDIELFGKHRLGFLREFLPYNNGIPSDDRLRRFFRILDPQVFEKKFERWIADLLKVSVAGKIVAIDGKTSRGSFDRDNKAIHVVSAFVGEDKITLAQRAVDCKTNEIKVIPELLEVLDLQGSIVTIDAMGTQYKIADQVIAKQANYILSLKGNQGSLELDVQDIFANISDIKTQYISTDETNDKDHGRLENRVCVVITDPYWLKWLKETRAEWNTINSVIRITSTRTVNGISSTEERFYISSLASTSAKQMLAYIRTHWAIENSLHWTLDVSFGDDKSRVRKGNAPQNMLLIKKAALNLLQVIKTRYPRIDGVRTSIARLRKMTGWVDEWLLKTLCAKSSTGVA
jgi:predicted transposase YbfD/YdcC